MTEDALRVVDRQLTAIAREIQSHTGLRNTNQIIVTAFKVFDTQRPQPRLRVVWPVEDLSQTIDFHCLLVFAGSAQTIQRNTHLFEIGRNNLPQMIP